MASLGFSVLLRGEVTDFWKCFGNWDLESYEKRFFGYLGYVEVGTRVTTHPYKWVICPLTRVINLHITSYQVS